MSNDTLQPDRPSSGGGIDPAFTDLLADPRNSLRRLPVSVPLDVFRTAANGFLARAIGPEVATVDALSITVGDRSLAARLYRPEAGKVLPVIVFFHGGGFLFGSLDTHDALCRALANQASMAVLAVDYRLAPEHPFPAALQDAKAALTWLRANGRRFRLDPDRVGVSGDSAGAHIAISLALSEAGRGAIRHVGLFYPLIQPGRPIGSYADYGTGHMLTASFLDWCWEAYDWPKAVEAGFDLGVADVFGLPSTTVVTAQFDPLRDQGVAFAARLQKAGVDVRAYDYPGMIHGFAGLPDLTPVADEAIAYVADGFKQAVSRTDGKG